MFDFFIYTYGPTILLAILTAVFGVLGYGAKKIYIGHMWNGYEIPEPEDEEYIYVTENGRVYHTNRECTHIRLSVRVVETAEALLKKKGITFDAEEMRVLIEAAVGEFNHVFQKPLENGSTADATRRVDNPKEE